MTKGQAFLAGWAALAGRLAWPVTLAALLATLALGWYAATRLGVNTDTTEMLSERLPFRQRAAALYRAFPELRRNLVMVVEGANADLVDQAADRLGAALARRPELADVLDPAGDPFFRRNGLLYLDPGALADLADRLAEAQPFLGALWQDPSLRGLARMLALAFEHLGGERSSAFDLGPPLAAMAEVAEAQRAGRWAVLSWETLLRGDGAGGPARRIIVARPVLDFASLAPARAAIGAVREAWAGLAVPPDSGLRLRLTGTAALAQDELRSVRDGMGLASLLSMLLVAGLLWLGLRSARMVAATLATLIAGLVWTGAFAAAAVGRLNLISVAFAVLFIGLAIDFGIHFALRFREEREAGLDHAGALRAAAAGVGGSLALTALAAALGFLAFLPTDYRGLSELGLISAAGMAIALVANLTLLPALLGLMPPRPRDTATLAAARGDHSAFAPIERHPRLVLAGAALLFAFGLALVPWVRFDFDPMNLRDPQTESVATLRDLAADPRIDPYAATVLAPDAGAAAALAERLRTLPEVGRVRSLADLVPAAQEEKLAIIGDMSLFLAPALSAAPLPPPSPQERLAALVELIASLRGWNGPGARRLADALEGIEPAELEARLLGTLPGRLERLRDALRAGPVGLADLPRSIVAREVAPDGRVRVQITPAGTARDTGTLRRFVEAVREVAPEVTGAPVIVVEAGRTVVRALAEAAGIAVLGISLLVALLFRDLRAVAHVFAPLLLAAVLTIAAAVLTGIPFNFANVIALPLLFGLGVASGLHLVGRARQTADPMATSTPRAVVFSALTTIGSFATIALSSHPGTASMGVLLTIAIALTMACTLVVLPALMALAPPR